jgi:GNAT superfamily N-acetyltransferase
MSASAFLGEKSVAFTGVRPVNLRTDLGGIAELIDLCFSVDEAGRATARELRALSQTGALLSLLQRMDRLLDGLGQGFVWLEAGRVVGNVSIAPADYPPDMGKGYIVANVAVHPDFRRRGIAKALVSKALEHIQARNGTFAILQVEAENHGARDLYRALGFYEERTFIKWQRSAMWRAPHKLDDMPFITLRQGNEWRAEYALARLVRPNRLGGVGWLRPTHPRTFRPSLWRSLEMLFSGQGIERWIVRSPDERSILAALCARTQFGGAVHLELLVHPSQAGKLERPLLNYVLRRFEGQHRALYMEHPADDALTSAVLEEYGFARRHTLVHMRRDLGGKLPQHGDA